MAESEETPLKQKLVYSITQAVYRSDRSNTDHVFSVKLLAEKAVTSIEYETLILPLDMNEAFDAAKHTSQYWEFSLCNK